MVGNEHISTKRTAGAWIFESGFVNGLLPVHCDAIAWMNCNSEKLANSIDAARMHMPSSWVVFVETTTLTKQQNMMNAGQCFDAGFTPHARTAAYGLTIGFLISSKRGADSVTITMKFATYIQPIPPSTVSWFAYCPFARADRNVELF
jgi:hypothetical protein